MVVGVFVLCASDPSWGSKTYDVGDVFGAADIYQDPRAVHSCEVCPDEGGFEEGDVFIDACAFQPERNTSVLLKDMPERSVCLDARCRMWCVPGLVSVSWRFPGFDVQEVGVTHVGEGSGDFVGRYSGVERGV